jgi:hypothetical protein
MNHTTGNVQPLPVYIHDGKVGSGIVDGPGSPVALHPERAALIHVVRAFPKIWCARTASQQDPDHLYPL